MRRPAVLTASCYILGIWGGSLTRGWGLPIPFALACAVLLLTASALFLGPFRWGDRAGTAAVPLLIAACGIARYLDAVQIAPDDIRRLPCFDREAAFTGVVAEEPFDREGIAHLTIGLAAVRTEDRESRVSGKLLLRIAGSGPDLRYGDRISFVGVLRSPRPPRNPGAFDSRAYADSRGVAGTVFLSDTLACRVLDRGQGDPWFARAILPVRRSVRQSVERDLSGNPAALLKGILLGDRQAFPQDLLDDFTVTGLTHILAVSGFNVAMVGLVGFTLLRALSLPRGASSLLVMALLALYALVTGMSPSVLRATLMAWALISGGMIERDTDALNTLALSAAVILGIWPLSLFDPGFQLSFVATLSLILLTRPLMDLARSLPGNRWKTWLWYPAAASLAAQAGSLPVMVGHFHAVSLVSFLANLPAAPLVSAATVLGLLTAIAGPAVPILGTLINGANYVILKLLLASVHLFAKVPWASVTVGGIHPLGYGLYYLGVGLCLPDIRSSRFGKPCLLLALLLANGLAWQGVNRPGPGLEVVFLDVGQGDSTCLRFPDGKTMLVDGGNRAERFDAGAQVVVPYLRAMGIRRLDAVVATHPHDDHIGGLVEVLRRIPVGRYLDAGAVPSTWASRRIGEILAERKIPRIPLSAGDSLSGLGGVGALVLGPFASPAPRDSSRNRSLDSNDGSVTLRIAHRDVVWLLPGDAERIAEARLLAWGKRLDCDILKAGHHGSSTSTGSRFLEAVSPSIVVVSVGERNRFGHPDPALMERLKAKGIRVCRTDREGAIWMRSDEGGLEVLRWMREKN